MNKKIFIEDGLSLYNKTGIGQYTINLANTLEKLGYSVVMPRKYFIERIKNPSIKRLLYILWLNLVFPFLLLFSRCEKVIFTNFLTPLYKIPTKKYFPVIHDLWAIKFPETMSKTKKNYQTWILNVIKCNYYKIITVSNTVKQEVMDYFKCSSNDISTVYNYFSFGEKPQINISEEDQKNVLSKFYIEDKKYILTVGSLNKRKNIQMLIDAYNLLDINKKLVIVGQKDNANLINKNTNIVFTNYIDDEELKTLYKHAFLFVFPSIYEGFGIPLIDAQAFGVPVLCSDIPIFHEVCASSAIYFDLEKNSIKNSLETTFGADETFINILKTNGFLNIHRYNISTLIKQMEGIFN